MGAAVMPRLYNKAWLIDQITDLRSKQFTYREIAEKIGVSWAWVKRVGKQLQLPKRQKATSMHEKLHKAVAQIGDS